MRRARARTGSRSWRGPARARSRRRAGPFDAIHQLLRGGHQRGGLLAQGGDVARLAVGGFEPGRARRSAPGRPASGSAAEAGAEPLVVGAPSSSPARMASPAARDPRRSAPHAAPASATIAPRPRAVRSADARELDRPSTSSSSSARRSARIRERSPRSSPARSSIASAGRARAMPRARRRDRRPPRRGCAGQRAASSSLRLSSSSSSSRRAPRVSTPRRSSPGRDRCPPAMSRHAGLPRCPRALSLRRRQVPSARIRASTALTQRTRSGRRADRHPVGLGLERGADQLRLRVLLLEAEQDRVVAGDPVDLLALQGDQAVGALGDHVRDDLGVLRCAASEVDPLVAQTRFPLMSPATGPSKTRARARADWRRGRRSRNRPASRGRS